MSILSFAVGMLTGILSGFGIGGGSLLILYLTNVAGMNQRSAGGINLLYFLCCAPAALIAHIKHHRIDKRAVLLCTLAGVPAAGDRVGYRPAAARIRGAAAVYRCERIDEQAKKIGKKSPPFSRYARRCTIDIFRQLCIIRIA